MEKTEDLAINESMPADVNARVQEIANNLNLADPSLSITYGTETMQNISRFADSLLERVDSKDAGQVGEILSNLMVQVKDVNMAEIGGAKKSFLESIPLVGNLFNSAKRSMAHFKTVSEQVDIISNKLEEAMVGLLYNIGVLEELYKHNKEFYQELSVYIEAGKLKLEQARTVDLPKLKEEAEASGDNMAAQKVRDFAEQMNRFERRLHDLQISRTITLQTAPQIRLIQNNSQTLAEKIQTSILSTIPIWKSQVVLALSMHGQQKAARLQQNVADTTNEMLRRNAEMLEQTTVETARQVERSVVDVETLRDVHAKLISTIEETLHIAQEGREKRLSVEKELVGMEQDLRTKLTTLAEAKTRDAIKGASGQGVSANSLSSSTSEPANPIPLKQK